MPAEILEESNPEIVDELPTDPSELSPDELVKDLTPQDTLSAEQPEQELPDKYKGKSLKDVVEMHQSAEKLIGKHSSEVGELRSMVDGYIKTQLTAGTQPAAQEEPEEIDFFENPAEAVNKAVQNHPDVAQARQATAQMQQQTAMSQMREKHSDMAEVLANPSFIEWVKGSPMRVEMYQRADQNYDVNAADELLSTFKERNTVVQETVQQEQQARQQQVKAAQTGSGSGANTSGAKRVYRRTDIIKLMKTDPARYDALSGEILQAYAEGRVK